jgi:hypothetical protein
MINIHKSNKEIKRLLTSKEFSTKVKIFFASKVAGDDYDPYEGNFTYTNSNPKTIKAYVRDIDVEKLVWKQYGFTESGAKEILTEAKYKDWFINCNKVEIDGDVYQVYKQASGNRALIEHRPLSIIRVVLRKTE